MALDTLAVLRGHFPPRAMGLVVEWAELHREDLRKVWERARAGQPLDNIAPLG